MMSSSRLARLRSCGRQRETRCCFWPLDSLSLKAADALAAAGVKVRVMDPFTVKPLDWEAVRGHAAVCGGRVITVEDHYPEGGLGDAVLASLAMVRNVVVKKLAVNAVPRSGPPMELLEMFGISASHIVKACNDIQKM